MLDEFVPGHDYESAAHELWALLGYAGGGLFEQRLNEVTAGLGLSTAAAAALLQLVPGEPISQRRLAERLHCTPSTVVDPTDKLESLGLVARQVHPRDRRINALVVTAAGKRVRQKLISLLLEPPEILRKLPAEDLERFRDTMRELARLRTPSEPAVRG
jgi:DNA-binding MarR family transcriptional regulator